MDYEVIGPDKKIIMDGQKERQGDFVFTATQTGEYQFCFNNQMSTFADKYVDFEISVSVQQKPPKMASIVSPFPHPYPPSSWANS